MKTITVILATIYTFSLASAQPPEDDLFDRLGDWDEEETMALKTFRSIKVVNMQSVEIPAPSELIFTVGHRFGNVRSGFYEMFGLDLATIRLSFDYGINSWLSAGVGRSTFEKTYDASTKARILVQDGRRGSPVSLSYYVAASQATLRDVFPAGYDNFSGRLSLASSLMIGRKFSEAFSMQVSPVWLRSNYLREIQDHTHIVSLALATRIRLTAITHLNMEYIHELTDSGLSNTNPLSVGFDLETGGHVFQLFFSNTQGIFDKAYLVNTTGTWGAGDIFFGFAITRVFYL
jgi:hypothetical protein